MKITPIASGQSPAPIDESNKPSASPDRIARAKAIAAGNSQINVVPSETHVDPQVERAQQSIRKIKMRTNVSPDRPLQEGSLDAQVPAVAAIPASTEAVPPVVEDTLPLDPQFATLAKQRRALQAREKELSDKEKALAAQSSSGDVEKLVARLKSEPLSVLQEQGVTYDQLTEAILANQSGNPEIHKLREELKAFKEGVDKQLTDKDAQAEQQVLAEIRKDIDRASQSGDEYEMIRATQSQHEVQELIHRVWKETGEVLDVSEAMQLVEDDLINESLKLVNTKKLKSKLAPPPQQQPPQRQIKTLTSRDTAKPFQSRRDRAIAAALGQLKR